jgi:hypothetical protein
MLTLTGPMILIRDALVLGTSYSSMKVQSPETASSNRQLLSPVPRQNTWPSHLGPMKLRGSAVSSLLWAKSQLGQPYYMATTKVASSWPIIRNTTPGRSTSMFDIMSFANLSQTKSSPLSTAHLRQTSRIFSPRVSLLSCFKTFHGLSFHQLEGACQNHKTS